MANLLFDAVLFDCDGVLVDSESITNRILTSMLGELGWCLTVEETTRIFVGKAVKDEAPLIEARTGVAITSEWLMQFRTRRNAALDRELIAIPGALLAVQMVHDEFNGRIAVASGADRRKVDLQLSKVGMVDYFEGRIFSGHEMARSKPYPDVYLAAAKALNVDPARCAIVEDTVTGVTAGVAAGAKVFGYSPREQGHSEPDALRRSGRRSGISENGRIARFALGMAKPRPLRTGSTSVQNSVRLLRRSGLMGQWSAQTVSKLKFTRF